MLPHYDKVTNLILELVLQGVDHVCPEVHLSCQAPRGLKG